MRRRNAHDAPRKNGARWRRLGQRRGNRKGAVFVAGSNAASADTSGRMTAHSPRGPTMDETSFRELLERARQRDQQAAAELVRRYGPALRVAVRARLGDRGLRRLLDSADVYQSVLADFFARAAGGQFELDRPEQLVGLLATMARNRLINLSARHRAARRD